MTTHSLHDIQVGQLIDDIEKYDGGWLLDNLGIEAAMQWGDFRPKWFNVLVCGCELTGDDILHVHGRLEPQVDCVLTRARFTILWRQSTIVLQEKEMHVPLFPSNTHNLRLEQRLWRK